MQCYTFNIVVFGHMLWNLSHLGALYGKKNLKTSKKTQKSKVTKQAPTLDDLLGNKARWGVKKPTMCCESHSISKAETGWFLFKHSDEFRAEYRNCYTPMYIKSFLLAEAWKKWKTDFSYWGAWVLAHAWLGDTRVHSFCLLPPQCQLPTTHLVQWQIWTICNSV